uniref:SFR19-like C-terminal domain-containing protein n=1 Tax=Myripristis murdjan TaxID=586833 RepID=A0A667ZEX7_9TELE
MGKVGKRSSLAAPPSSSLTGPAALKSKKAKPSSTTSTSSSASSPSSSLVTKRRRRLGKKAREKGSAVGLIDGDSSQSKSASEGWCGVSSEIQSGVGGGSKLVSPHTGQAGPAPCSSSASSSSSTSALPPSSSPPHTPPPSMAPSRDTRESSPDSQTVDSSCKTPEPSFLAEDCPTQTSPTLPPSSPTSLSTPQGTGLTMPLPTASIKPLPPDDAPKSLASPPCSSSSSGCGLPSLSLPPSSSDPPSSSSSVSSSSASKPPPPPPPPPAAPALPWSLQTVTALLFKMEEANIASRAKAQEFIQATSQVRDSFLSSLCIRHLTLYLKKLHTQERAVEEVKLAIKPYYQRKDINKDEYKDILRKAVHKICHSRTGEINPVKVSNLVKLYVQRYKYFRKHGRKMDEEERDDRELGPPSQAPLHVIWSGDAINRLCFYCFHIPPSLRSHVILCELLLSLLSVVLL